MRIKILLLFTCLLFASPGWATAYFLNTAGGGGSDANNGTSVGTPWLSPNHAVNCGDTITAAASTSYSATNFAAGKWGAVTCAGNNNVAWLTCATFDGCKITSNSNNGMKISASYWGVQGWEVTTTTGGFSCFAVQSTSGVLHHIIFANDIANGCISSGFTTANTGTTASEDYLVIIGNIAWNTAQTSSFCDSGITVYQPLAQDSAPGTHIYIAGNFTYDNVVPTNCSGGSATYDGEGIALDSLDFGQGGGTAYAQQVVVDNNISFLNSGYGVGGTGSGNSAAHIYARHNTSYGNMTANPSSTFTCGDMVFLANSLFANLEAYQNLVMTSAGTRCSGGTQVLYAVQVSGGNSTDTVYNNFLYSAAGHNTLGSGVTFLNNTTGTNPSFISVADPGAPSCGAASSVTNCMATVIANFTPATAAAKPYGYQPVSTTSRYDPLYPQWLCAVTNLPTGLVTPGCLPASLVITGATVK